MSSSSTASGRLTEEGEVVVARARRMMAEMDAMVSDVIAMRHEVRGTVRVGMIGTTGRWLVPQLFARLRERHPEVRMTVADGTSTTLEPQLLSGQLDLAVVTMPVPGDARRRRCSRRISSSSFPSITPSSAPSGSAGAIDHRRHCPTTRPTARPRMGQQPAAHRRAARQPAGPRATGQPATASPRCRSSRARRHRAPAADAGHRAARGDRRGRPAGGHHAAPVDGVDGLRMIASLTFDGYGPAILPATAVPGHLRDRFALVPLEGFPRRQVGVALRSRGLPSAPTRALIDLLYVVVQDPRPLLEGLHPAAGSRTRRR